MRLDQGGWVSRVTAGISASLTVGLQPGCRDDVPHAACSMLPATLVPPQCQGLLPHTRHERRVAGRNVPLRVCASRPHTIPQTSSVPCPSTRTATRTDPRRSPSLAGATTGCSGRGRTATSWRRAWRRLHTRCAPAPLYRVPGCRDSRRFDAWRDAHATRAMHSTSASGRQLAQAACRTHSCQLLTPWLMWFAPCPTPVPPSPCLVLQVRRLQLKHMVLEARDISLICGALPHLQVRNCALRWAE